MPNPQYIPEWLQIAFSDWVVGHLYKDNQGNYRLKIAGRRIAPYNSRLKQAYPDSIDFHKAAHAWLALWERVPIARL